MSDRRDIDRPAHERAQADDVPHDVHHGVPADQPPSPLPDPASIPDSEAQRQALDTVRSISRLEESNDERRRPGARAGE